MLGGTMVLEQSSLNSDCLKPESELHVAPSARGAGRAHGRHYSGISTTFIGDSGRFVVRLQRFKELDRAFRIF
jgi:hypothetical protein